MSGTGRVRTDNKEATQLRKLLKAVGVEAPKDSKKIYEKAINKLHTEEHEFASRGKRRIFTRLVEKYSTFRYPGLFNDYNSKTRSDSKTLRGIHRSNRRIQNNASDRGGYLTGLVQDMLEQTRGSRVTYNSYEKTALEVARGAKSDCTELVRYAYARLKLSGFDPKLVLVSNTKQVGMVVNKTRVAFHLMVAVKDPVGLREHIYIDLYHGGFVAKPRHVRFLPANTAMSIHHQNLGVHYAEMGDEFGEYEKRAQSKARTTLGSQVLLGVATFFKMASNKKAEEHYDAAIRYDETYPLSYYGKAHLLWSTGADQGKARELVSKALKLMPGYEEAQFLYAWLDSQ